MRLAFALAGLLGGTCWIAAYVVDKVVDGGPSDPLSYAGGVLLAIAVLGAGAGLVSSGAGWLRVLVAVCFLALVACVLLVLRRAGDPVVVDALVGVLAVAGAIIALRRAPRATAEGAVGGHRAGRSHAR